MNVAIIPARGGSTRIKNKNTRLFHGKPILAYSIETAKMSGCFDRIIVSSDDARTLEIAAEYGAKLHRRDPAFARNEVGTQEVTKNVLQWWTASNARGPGPEFACCIYATAPTMTAVDLRIGYNVMREREDYGYIHGWFYFGRTAWFLEGRRLGEEMPRPAHWIDINYEEDWKRAEEMRAALLP